MTNTYQIYLVSDSTGETLSKVSPVESETKYI